MINSQRIWREENESKNNDGSSGHFEYVFHYKLFKPCNQSSNNNQHTNIYA